LNHSKNQLFELDDAPAGLQGQLAEIVINRTASRDRESEVQKMEKMIANMDKLIICVCNDCVQRCLGTLFIVKHYHV
jgi:hypothetical protein